MFNFVVKRSQHAVGHGGFHTGSVSAFDLHEIGTELTERAAANFNYVYDCGSEQSVAFNNEMAAYRLASAGRTDILFVSHLHADHINGIDRLQAMAPATTVVVPYLDLIERLIFVLADFHAGTCSSSALEYFRDPIDWWQRRGAKHIIFLEPGTGDDVPPGRPDDRDGPAGSPEDRRETGETQRLKEKLPKARLASHLLMPRSAAPEGLEPADPAKREGSGGAVLAGAGSSFQLEWQTAGQTNWQVGDWILLPYVHPLDDNSRSRFRAALKKQLKIRGNDQARLSKELLEWLTSFERTKELVELYSTHISKSHNSVSMSLYSGPLREVGHTGGAERQWENSWHIYDNVYPGHYYLEPCGWLGTGDSALGQSKWRDPWMSFFGPFASDVRVLTLPHHGSAHNFHEDILFGRLRIVLATTVERRNRVARMRETLGLVEARSIATRVVDDQHGNAYTLVCRRTVS